MGLISAKLRHKLQMKMRNQKNISKKLSLMPPLMMKHFSCPLLIVKTNSDRSNKERLSTYSRDKVMTSVDITKMYTELPMESFPFETLTNREKTKYSTKIPYLTKPQLYYSKGPMERLGLHEFKSNNKIPFFSKAIYLPECCISIGHYITLYKLKLDNLSQCEFESWCLARGHKRTASKYSELLRVYLDLKAKYFKESFIINKILSRQNVHLRITDIFCAEQISLRALIVVGKRNIVQNVIDSYCFDVQGKVPFIIKTVDDYKMFIKPINEEGIYDRSDDFFFTNNNENMNNVETMFYSKIKTDPIILKGSRFIKQKEKIMSSENVLKSDQTDFFHKAVSHTNLEYKPYTNYMQYQECKTVDPKTFVNYPIIYQGSSYDLETIITDKTYAYILCTNHLHSLNLHKTDYKSLMLDGSSTLIGNNQSNSFHRIHALKQIMKTEITETFSKRVYGLPLNQIPCSQFYVVQCTIEGRLSEKEATIDRVLMRHMVCGKVISKKYNLENNDHGISFIMHLHGNERHIRKCCNDFVKEELANKFKLIHPRDGKILQERREF